MNRTQAVCLLALTVCITIPAFADTTLYTNGPVNGNAVGWSIASLGFLPNFCCTLSDSFNVPNSTVTGITFYTWSNVGDVATTVDWAITTGPLSGTTLASGTAALTSTFLFLNGHGFDVNSDSFTIPALALGAGTYWLQLGGATDSFGFKAVFWDGNGGPSQAWSTFYGPGPITPGNDNSCALTNAIGECSQAFLITGTTGAVPEPSSLILLGSGLAGAARMLRRKLIA